MTDEPERSPSKLYKLRRLTDPTQQEFTRQIIVESELYFASPESFNDPFDTLPTTSIAGSRLRREFALRQMLREEPCAGNRKQRSALKRRLLSASRADLQRSMEEAAKHTRNALGVCSLTAKSDDVLMWSHYGENHTGLCLVFETRAVRSILSQALKVSYSHQRPVLNRVAPHPEEDVAEALLTKADFWAYEEEWRIIHPQFKPGKVRFPPEALQAVIIGARMTEEHQKLLFRWLNARPVPTEVLRAVPDRDTFTLSIVSEPRLRSAGRSA